MMSVLRRLRRATRQLLREIKARPQRITQTLGDHSKIIADLVREGIVKSHIRAIQSTAAPVFRGIVPPNDPPISPSLFIGGDGIRFPGIESSIRYLQSLQVVTPEQMQALDNSAKRSAFTIARITTQDAVREIRDAFQDDLREGGTLAEFRDRIADAVQGSGLGSAAIETIYRTNVGHAAAAGKRAILAHPLVGDQFPYLLWTATHDGRTRPDHLAMEKHGQNGTAVYRADDPMWRILYPPCSWNCRCEAIHLSIADAAYHGSKEAREWLRTGIPPTNPEYAKRPYPVIVPKGWPTHDGIVAVV